MTPATTTLIGRDHPAGILRAEISRVAQSHGGLVLVTGEAGIGKTTLATGAAEEARHQGALVLGGACWDSDSAPGYWPWVQVVRALRRAATREEWAVAEEAGGRSLPVLLGDREGPDSSETFALYDGVSTALAAVSQSRPVVIVLDDLHWADTASLRLLGFVAQHTWFERLLIIGTYRDVEVETAGHPLRPLMQPLVAKATTVTLTGLGRDEVGALMARTVGREPEEELVAEVHRRTGGNPFFVEQTARLWHSGGSASAVAPGVRDALRRRLSLLPERVVRLLTTAAVLGREFHRQVLAAAAGTPVPEADRLLEQAAAARLVTARGAGRFVFAHDLVRETLYGSLSEEEARRRHAAVVRAFDSAHPSAEGDPMAERPADDVWGRLFRTDLARHAYLAREELGAPRAVDQLLAAARDATAWLATEEALGHYRRAYELAAEGEPCRRVMIALEVGRELYQAGSVRDAWRAFDAAVADVREVDDPELLARVALTLYRVHAPEGHDSREELRTGLVRQAHSRLVRGASADGAEQGGRAGPAADEDADPDRLARELTVRVAVLARRGKDDEALGFSLWTLHDAIWGLGSAAERETLIDEIIAVARRTADTEMEGYASSFRWVALLEQGDVRCLDQFHAFVALAERADQPRFTFASRIDQSIIRAFMGRFAEAEALLDRAIDAYRDHQHIFFVHMANHLRWALWLRQGRFGELAELHRTLDEDGHPHHRLLEAVVAVERGDTRLALRHLRDREAAGPDPYPRAFGPLWLRFQAQAAAASGDPELCERARAALAPYRGQWAVSLYGCDISGPFDLWSAVLDAAQGRWDAAVAGFTAAQESADRLQARPWSLDARARLAEVLAARGAPGDADAAAVLAEAVAREADELGMRHLAERVRLSRGAATAEPEAVRTDRAAGPADVVSAPQAADAVRTPDPAGAAAAPRAADVVRVAGAAIVVRASDAADGVGAAGSAAAVVRGSAASPGRDGARPAAGSGEFRGDGAVWSLTFDGLTVHVPDAKGLRDLHTLLGHPGEDIPAVRLLAPEGGEAVVAARRLGGDPVLDDEAKARYKHRLARLDEEIDRATGRGDDQRAAEYDREREALLTELRAAAGLAGRGRRLGDEAERARKTVTARIRDTLRKLADRHPALAGHLRESVSTGSTCRYLPERTITWRL